MDLDRDVCLRALRTRDARFDGRFFVGVRTTGIFCRPICPARPKPENCDFYPSAAAAQEAGLRPCLRCRPEASPGTPAWIGTSATVSRALRLIADGALDDGGIGEMAERLGIGERHLRRLFDRHLVASPLAVAQMRRVLFAKRLIDDTSLPMSEIALAAGFRSQRRFNEALRATYAMSPSELRQRARRTADKRRSPRRTSQVPVPIELHLPYRAPLAWNALLAYFAVRATPGVEQVELEGVGVYAGGVYRRTITLNDAAGWVEVANDAGASCLVARFAVSHGAELLRGVERLRRVFDLGADPAAIAAELSRDPLLRGSVAARPGLRVPGAWDGFELAVRAILGQQVSVKGATTLAVRLVEHFGEAPASLVAAPPGLQRLFPTPQVLAAADVASIGMPSARAEAVRSLAQAVASGALELDGALELGEALRALRALPGIGEWTAQYVALRALREPDAFPAGDLALRRALAGRCTGAALERGNTSAARPNDITLGRRKSGDRGQAGAVRHRKRAAQGGAARELGADAVRVAAKLPTPRQLEALAERWRPWRAYASLHLWNVDADATAHPNSVA